MGQKPGRNELSRKVRRSTDSFWQEASRSRDGVASEGFKNITRTYIKHTLLFSWRVYHHFSISVRYSFFHFPPFPPQPSSSFPPLSPLCQHKDDPRALHLHLVAPCTPMILFLNCPPPGTLSCITSMHDLALFPTLTLTLTPPSRYVSLLQRGLEHRPSAAPELRVDLLPLLRDLALGQHGLQVRTRHVHR